MPDGQPGAGGAHLHVSFRTMCGREIQVGHLALGGGRHPAQRRLDSTVRCPRPGASGGGILKGGLITGIGWGLFGLFAGALYGLWAGRSVSARRLKGIRPLIAPRSSMLLAWAEGSVSQQTIDTLTAPQSQRLVLHFNPTEHGAILEAA